MNLDKSQLINFENQEFVYEKKVLGRNFKYNLNSK